MVNEGLEQQRADRQPTQGLRLVMDAEAHIGVDPDHEHPGQHGQMHRIDPEDPAREKGADAAPFDAAIHRRQDESAENEEDVDARVAVMGEARPQAVPDIGHAELEMHGDNPEGSETANGCECNAFLPHRVREIRGSG